MLTPDFYGVNTMQPPYQPSGNAPAPGGDPAYADPDRPNTLSPQTATNIGDLLTQKGIELGVVRRRLAGRARRRRAARASNFQFHHQPFNYYAKLRARHAPRARSTCAMAASTAPRSSPASTPARCRRSRSTSRRATRTSMPATPTSRRRPAHRRRHRASGQQPAVANMVVVVTWDENGGWWDHVAPPKGDRWGPGTRIPAIIVSPFAKRGIRRSHAVRHRLGRCA